MALGARSTLKVSFSDSERYVALTAGEAFFTVNKDATRPLVVSVEDKRVRVLGTQFEVHRGPGTVRVAVVQGLVEVSRAGKTKIEEKQLLEAGQQIEAPVRGRLQTVKKIKAAEPAAWRNGRLVYVDAPLREVVADANRYSTQRIEISGEELEKLQVSVTYRADQVEDMVNSLSRVLPIEVVRSSSGQVILKSVDSGAHPSQRRSPNYRVKR